MQTEEQKEKPKQETKVKKASFMMLWFEQYYKMTSIVLCAVALVFSYMFVLGPKVSVIRSVRGARYDKAIEEKAELEEKLAYLVKAQESKRNISQREIENIDSVIPTSPLTPQILTGLEEIAKASNVVIEGIDLAIPDTSKKAVSSQVQEIKIEPEFPEGVFTVEIGLSITSGPYDNLKLFLSNLEKNIRLMDVISVNYSQASKNYAITARAYYTL